MEDPEGQRGQADEPSRQQGARDSQAGFGRKARAGSVGAQKATDLARVDLQGQVLDGRNAFPAAAEYLAQVLGADGSQFADLHLLDWDGIPQHRGRRLSDTIHQCREQRGYLPQAGPDQRSAGIGLQVGRHPHYLQAQPVTGEQGAG